MAGESELRRTFYMVGIVALAGALLYWARPVLIPLTLAILVTFVLAPLVSWLERYGVPRFLACTIAILGSAVLLIGITHVFISQVGSLTSDIPAYKAQISAKVGDLRHATANSWVAGVMDFANDLARDPDAPKPAPEQKDEPIVTRMEIPILAVVQSIASTALEVLVATVIIFVMALLMLMRREDLRNRVIHLLGSDNRVSATRVLDDASKRVSRFLFSQLLLNLGFGAVVTIALYFIGIPYAYVWGALAALLRYVPFLGGWIGAAFPLLASLVMPDWTPFFLTASFFIAAELVQAYLIEPLVFGHSIGVSGAGQVIAMLCWASLWGPVGLVLSTPLTACLCVLGQHFPGFRFFSTLMGDGEVVERPAAFYQRLLAGDVSEASSLIAGFLKDASTERAVDEMLIPALLAAQSDHRRGDLSREDQLSIIDAVREVFYEAVSPETADGESPPPEDESKKQILVVLFPFNDETDSLILEMLQRTAGRHAIPWSTEAISQLDAIAQEGDFDYSTILITTAAPRNLARIRGACKSVRKLLPQAKMVVCCWSLEAQSDPNRPETGGTGATVLCTSFAQARQLVDQSMPARTAPPLVASQASGGER